MYDSFENIKRGIKEEWLLMLTIKIFLLNLPKIYCETWIFLYTCVKQYKLANWYFVC